MSNNIIPSDIILHPFRNNQTVKRLADYDLTLVAVAGMLFLVGFVAGALIF